MSIAAVSYTGAVQLDSTKNSLTVACTPAQNHAVVVHIAVASAVVTVASVTDQAGNAFTRQASVLANREVDYTTGRYFKHPIKDEYVDGEAWTAVAAASVTSIIVTLTGGAKFSVAIEEYSGNNTTPATAFPHAASSAEASSSAPSITIASATGTSFISAGFNSTFGLNQAAGANSTLRGYTTASTNSLNNASGVATAVADSLASSSTTVALAPVSQEEVDGISGSPGSPSASQLTIAVPATYAVCAVEVHV